MSKSVSILFTLIILITLAGLTGGTLLAACGKSPQEALVIINNTPVPPIPKLDPVRIARGADLYAQYCANCHGVNLEGAPDWKIPLPDGSLPPPPQDSSGHTWHHPDALLISIIAEGGDPIYNSKMPAFGDRLSRDEIDAILDFLKSRWGIEERAFQWWISETQSK